MKLKIILRYVLVIAIVGYMGCSGEDGDMGPAGPQGEQGIQGEPGADGVNGTDGVDGADGATGPRGLPGEDGNANVIYSDRFSPNWNLINQPRIKRMVINNPDFGRNYDDGVILFYWTTGNGSTFLLPWNTFSSFDGTLDTSRVSVIKGGSGDAWIEIRKYGSDFTDSETVGSNRLRYVIIPGGVNTSAKNTIDYTDYEAVKNFYHIPD